MNQPRSNVATAERIPRRQAPDFEESDAGMLASISEDGFLNVALNASNQYGPHAMIMLLGIFASITGVVLLLLMAIT